METLKIQKLFYARPNQLLKEHLLSVSQMTSDNASKLGLTQIGKLLGLIHDLGKYSFEFQAYVLSKDKSKKGHIDHSTAGGQILYDKLRDNLGTTTEKFLAEIISLCSFSHHSGLIDMLNLSGENVFEERKNKGFNKTHKEEVLQNIEKEIKEKLDNINFSELSKELQTIYNKIIAAEGSNIYKSFSLGMLARFLLSCLIDADHTDSANAEQRHNCEHSDKEIHKICHSRESRRLIWNVIAQKLENHIESLNKTNKSADKVKDIRQQISGQCFNAGKTRPKGCYKLEVPTGGGKTLASFRFAVEMAKQYNADRIIYCIPYTTIIEQNAEVIRSIVETEKRDDGKIVLEHHSNLSSKKREPDDEQIDQNEILMQSWDVPVIFTTNVRILETLFGGGTTNARRLHQLANSIIIFDEIQTLPIKCVHLFNNAINFLVDFCGATVVLCTATQPLLDRANEKDFKFGSLKLSDNLDIIPNIKNTFDSLKRVEIIMEDLNGTKALDFIGNKVIELANENTNCLVVCNTTKSAKEIFEYIFNEVKDSYKIYHLSARMVPIHRKWILRCIKFGLKNKVKLIVVSTQVIEAGVDIDFNCAIRALAGLDSILQTAGRVNRNGLNKIKNLYVYKFNDNSDCIEYISAGAQTTYNIIKQYADLKMSDIQMIDKYYDDLYAQFQKQMKYLSKEIGDSLLNLLSCNKNNPNTRTMQNSLRQSFSTANSNFKAIDNITTSVIVDKGKAHKIIEKFGKVFDPKIKKNLIRELNKYSVNIYPKQKENLHKAIHQISDDLEIFYIDKEYYDKNFGITEEYTIDNGGIC